MSTQLLHTLGLRPDPTSLTAVPNLSAHFLMFVFLWTNGITSTRPAKFRMGLDHQVAPREDVTKYGDHAVKAGKITPAQLARLRRNEAAHANAFEALPFFVGTLLLANLAHVPNELINRTCLIWCVVRAVYHFLYLGMDASWGRVTLIRGVAWWTGNVILLRLAWACRIGLNGLQY